MEILEYCSKYEEEVKDLLVELQQYISEIDKEKYNILTDEYREKYLKKTIEEVCKYEGKIYLAKDSDRIVGLIVGLINNEEIHSYDFEAPKRGRITELVISKNYRSNGLGKQLLDKMEQYFKEVDCKAILLDVFSYNENAKRFYEKNGYFNRTEEMMKLI